MERIEQRPVLWIRFQDKKGKFLWSEPVKKPGSLVYPGDQICHDDSGWWTVELTRIEDGPSGRTQIVTVIPGQGCG